MYVPWQGYNPSNNLGNQTADAPWVNDTHMPCPEGYRIPTGNEWQSLLPADQEIPGRYKAGNGETIAATLHIGEGTLITPSSGVTGTQHYVKFTSEDTGRSLIIPLLARREISRHPIIRLSGKELCCGQTNVTVFRAVMHGLTGCRSKEPSQPLLRNSGYRWKHLHPYVV